MVVVDHINGNGLDNRKSNLRVTNITVNSQNRRAKNKNNTSGYRNVQWDKRRNKWSVILQVNHKNTRLGSFDDIHEAGRFAQEMRKKYYPESKVTL